MKGQKSIKKTKVVTHEQVGMSRVDINILNNYFIKTPFKDQANDDGPAFKKKRM
ncbi:hypothetical protein [Mucilaginibacter lappiensis]|uniref:hypothetical protein n=1 Tax=Mucilaginibacter lappiensis TaxID=354630 RepID=UPI003D25E7C1